MRILLLLGLMVLVVSGFGLIQLSRPTTPASFTKTLETLQAQREVLTGGPLRQTGSPAPEPAALTVAGILAETNRHRAEAGLPALTLNESLSQAAESKVTDMFAGQYFEHVSPSGQGPEDLVETRDLDHVAHVSAGVLAGERTVIHRMPVLRCDDELIRRHQPIGNRDHLVAARNGERATWHEVILDVDKDQCFHDSP